MVTLPYKLAKWYGLYRKTNHTFYGAYVDNDLKGSICINEQGKISFIFIDKEYRNRGIGSKLLQVARDELNLESLLISFPNNSLTGRVFKENWIWKEFFSTIWNVCITVKSEEVILSLLFCTILIFTLYNILFYVE